MSRTAPKRSASAGRGKLQAAKTARRGPVAGEDEIYQLVTKAIIAKQLRPGSRLKEAALAAQFGVSRSRMRRVFQRLVDLDFVEFRLNHGPLVRRPPPPAPPPLLAPPPPIHASALPPHPPP